MIFFIDKLKFKKKFVKSQKDEQKLVLYLFVLQNLSKENSSKLIHFLNINFKKKIVFYKIQIYLLKIFIIRIGIHILLKPISNI